MTKAHQKSLQTKLDNKLINLIKPVGMLPDQYKIACNLEGVEPTVRNGSFLHWVMTTDDGPGSDVADEVHELIINAIRKKYLLDPDDVEQCSYFCDAIRDNITKRKEYVTNLIEATFEGYPNTPMFDYCRTLNKAFGFTSQYYFSSNHKSIVDAIKEVING